MKKIIVFLCLLFSFRLFSVGFDFSVGGSLRFGYQYSFYMFHGLYGQITIPLSFTFYPGLDDTFSFGFKNKAGYRFIGYGKNYSKSESQSAGFTKTIYYEAFANYNNYPVEHEIYENLSYIIKAGKSVKFIAALGCTAKYSFLNIPEGEFYVTNTLNYYSRSGNFSYITPGFYTYFSIGPSVEVGIELINKPKTFSMNIGIPLEFLIPVNSINFTKLYVDDIASWTFPLTKEKYNNNSWFNFSIGLEFTFSFYTFKKIL